MLTVEQYITQMKKKDNLDEFDFKKHAENMAAVMKYVVEYFNSYLNPEEYDYEAVKLEQTAAKIEREIADVYPQSKDFIIEYYKKYKARIDRTLRSHIKSLEYMELFYSDDDFENAVNEYCDDRKMQETDALQYKKELLVLAREIKDRETEKPSRAGYKYLDEALVSWVNATYAEYRVNLFDFAYAVTSSYFDKHIELIRDGNSERYYYINRYNHRYNSNPFGINELYKEISHRPFIQGRKGELEMLIMYEWLFSHRVEDAEYWPEYVNLCVATGRVSMARNMNMLIPVINKGIAYPADIAGAMTLAETATGALKIAPGSPYILRLVFEKDHDLIWKDDEKLDTTIRNLQETFAAYGAPYALELLSPLRTPTYNEKEFFARYSLLEKKLKKYQEMVIALVNGPQRSGAKSSYLMQTTEDVIKIRTLAKEMKFRLKISLDISKLIKSKNYQSQFEQDFNQLSEIRHSIVGVHLSNCFPGDRISGPIYKDDKVYLNQFDYPKLSDFLGSVAALFNDNQRRYFVPEGVDNPEELEELVDNLLRGGFSFIEPGGDNGNEGGR